MPPSTGLPLEIWFMVFVFLHQASTGGELRELHDLLLVSKEFKLLLEPLLYKTITQSDLYSGYTPKPKAISRLFRTFLLNSGLALHVRSIYVEEVDVYHDVMTVGNAELLTYTERNMVRKLVRQKGLSSMSKRFKSTSNLDLNAVLGLILSQLSNLQSLRLVLWYGRLEGYVSRSNFQYLQTLDLSWQSEGCFLDLEEDDLPQGPVATLRHLVKSTASLRNVNITAYYGPIRPNLTAEVEADVSRTRDILLGHKSTLKKQDLSFVEDPLYF